MEEELPNTPAKSKVGSAKSADSAKSTAPNDKAHIDTSAPNVSSPNSDVDSTEPDHDSDESDDDDDSDESEDDADSDDDAEKSGDESDEADPDSKESAAQATDTDVLARESELSSEFVVVSEGPEADSEEPVAIPEEPVEPEVCSTITSQHFERLFEMVLRKRQPYDKKHLFEMDPKLWELTVMNQKHVDVITFPLAPAFKNYNKTGDSKKLAMLHRYVSKIIDAKNYSTTTPTDVRAKLLPSLRAQTTYDIQNWKAWQVERQSKHSMPALPYADQYAVGLIYEDAEAIRHVRDTDLVGWEFSLKIAMDAAVKNLRAISNENFRQVHPGFYCSPWRDMHDSARILLIDLFQGLDVDGDVVAMAPNPNSLFVTGSEDYVGLELMITIAGLLFDQPLSIPAMPVQLKAGAWEVFAVPPRHALAEQINVLRLRTLKKLYDLQQPLISTGFFEGHTKHHAAQFIVKQDEKLNLFYSMCSTEEGAEQSLPYCDFIEFYKSNGQQVVCQARASMPDVLQVLKTNLKKVEFIYPPLLELDKFPTGNELRQMGYKPTQSFLARYVKIDDTARLQSLLTTTLPHKVRLLGDTKYGDISKGEHFVEQCFEVITPPDQIVAFFKEQFKTSLSEETQTNLGKTIIVSSITASLRREARIAPGKSGGTLLLMTKTTVFECPGLLSALSESTAENAALEQLFGLSLYPGSLPMGPPEISGMILTQQFFIPDPAQEAYAQSGYSQSGGIPPASEAARVVEFYRIQLAGPDLMLHSPTRERPCMLVNKELSRAAAMAQEENGTLVEISLDLPMPPEVR